MADTPTEEKRTIENSGLKPRRRSTKTKSIGDSGVNYYSSTRERSQELLAELQGKEGSIRYRQMSRGDGQVGMIMKCHKNPIRSASWSFEEKDDATDQEKLCIELLSEWFFKDHPVNFDTLLSQVLSFLDYGFSVFELTYELYKHNGGLYYVPNMEQRVQTSIDDIFPEKDKQYIRQTTFQKGTVEIPFEFLAFFILDQQGEDMRGESILRTSYPAWKDKKLYEQWQGMGIQRSAGGIPKGKVPKGTDPESQLYIDFKDMLENLTVHEDAYIIVPEDWDVELMQIPFQADHVQKAIDAKNSEMAMSVLTQFILLGQGSRGGSFALARDQSDFFLDGLQYVVNLIQHGFHRQVITPFVQLNFGDSVDPSRIVLRGVNLNKKVGTELSDVLQRLDTAGFMKGTVDDEIHLRKCLEMPELSEEEIEARREQKKRIMDALEKGDNPFQPGTDPDDPKKSPKKASQAPKKAGKNDDGEDPDDGSVKLSEKVSGRRRKRKNYMARTEKEVRSVMEANLLLMKDKLMADIERTLRRGSVEINGLKNIQVGGTKSYRTGLEKKLAGIAIESVNNAREDAAVNNIKLAEPKDIRNKNTKNFILNEAEAVVDNQASTLKNRAILTATNGPLKGYSIEQTLSNVDKITEEYIRSNAILVSANLVTAETANYAEMQFYKEIEEQLWGYRFVAVDDDRTTQICQFYNGKTFSINSAELSIASPPLHSNCRSYLEPIYRSEEKPEDIDDVVAPPSIMKQKNIL